MKPTLFSLVLPLLLGLLLAGCAKTGSGPAMPSDVDYYTCTMHPSVHSHDPDAKCPICGMDLVAVKKTGAAAPASPASSKDMGGMAMGGAMRGSAPSDQPHEFTVPLDRQQLIGVTYAEVRRQPLRRTIRAVGVVAAVTDKHWDYVSRVDGYIHDLKVSAPGDPVEKGQVLMDLYSPDLVATEQEFVDLLKMRDGARSQQDPALEENAEHLLTGARARLEQWNIAPEQIGALEKSRMVGANLALQAPFSGVVEEVPVHQGRHVSVGDHLVDIVDLSSVWVWVDFYENELPQVKPGLPVTITSASAPGLSSAGKIALVDPFLNEQTRTGRVRIDVPNPAGQLRPGAYVDVALSLDEGTGLVVPFGAVLPTGERNIVFVDKGGGRLEPRFIQVGGKFGDSYQVTAGLAEGDRIVASGNFLIDAESKVQGALKDF
ncbi:MAG TPA: efflux RND transporter periplasmic adaptor subunit [Bryobacteraceae bacterium]|nr:efflux RND transporter periplasmic adaptor subunit [Bryobacteraceae bacterium]